MDFPSYLPTVSSSKCPHCGNRIGMHLVRGKFQCPHCGTSLSSNVSRAFNEGTFLFAFILALWAGFHFIEGSSPFNFGFTLVSIAAFYLGHALYRYRLCISKA